MNRFSLYILNLDRRNHGRRAGGLSAGNHSSIRRSSRQWYAALDSRRALVAHRCRRPCRDRSRRRRHSLFASYGTIGNSAEFARPLGRRPRRVGAGRGRVPAVGSPLCGRNRGGTGSRRLFELVRCGESSGTAAYSGSPRRRLDSHRRAWRRCCCLPAPTRYPRPPKARGKPKTTVLRTRKTGVGKEAPPRRVRQPAGP